MLRYACVSASLLAEEFCMHCCTSVPCKMVVHHHMYLADVRAKLDRASRCIPCCRDMSSPVSYVDLQDAGSAATGLRVQLGGKH